MRESSFKVGDDGASSVLTGRERVEEEEVKTSPRKTWKVPGKGTLEFDYHTAHPCETLIEHLTFDLQKPREKAAFLDLWTRASHLRGQNLWNCKLGTRVMQIPESLLREAAALHASIIRNLVFRLHLLRTKGIDKMDGPLLRTSSESYRSQGQGGPCDASAEGCLQHCQGRVHD